MILKHLSIIMKQLLRRFSVKNKEPRGTPRRTVREPLVSRKLWIKTRLKSYLYLFYILGIFILNIYSLILILVFSPSLPYREVNGSLAAVARGVHVDFGLMVADDAVHWHRGQQVSFRAGLRIVVFRRVSCVLPEIKDIMIWDSGIT